VTSRNFVWWGIFTITGIWLQQLVPGVDFLIPGLLYALQERNIPQLAWILPAFVLIQEGLGSLDFGAVILWYLTAIFVFMVGHWIFQAENWLFILMVSALTAASHYMVISLMCSLQALSFDRSLLLHDSVIQAALIPFVWKLASVSRRKVRLHEDSA